MTGRKQLVAILFTLALVVRAAFSSVSYTAACDDEPAERAALDYAAMFGNQLRMGAIEGHLRRLAIDLQRGTNLSIVLVPGEHVELTLPTVLTKMGDEVIEVEREQFEIDEDKWYLVARVEPLGVTVKSLSVIIESGPLEAAYVRLRALDSFSREPSMAIYELSEDIEVSRIMMPAYRPAIVFRK